MLNKVDPGNLERCERVKLICSLPFTDAVLMEAQRISSIAPLAVPHFALKETQLQGYTIPKVFTCYLI